MFPMTAFLWVMTWTLQSILYFYVSRATSTRDTSSTQVIILPPSQIQLPLSSSTGDFNGDGFEDILIGQSFVTTNGVFNPSGVVYVIFGTAGGIPNIDLATTTMSLSEGIQITGPINGQLGYSVAGLGDINGDNIDDFILGAPNAGKVYVIFGQTNGQLSNIDLSSTDISATNQGIVISGTASDGLGIQVGSAGDFNDDSINDFMVSLPFFNSNQGLVYVIFGKNGISSSFDLTIPLVLSQGFQIIGGTSSRLGMSLSKAGDVNGDGIDDIMAGTSAQAGGMVVIVYGTKSLIPTLQADNLVSSQGIIITGSSSSLIGSTNSISSAGDLNNDGIDDIALGVSDYGSSSIPDYGMVYIIYGEKGGFSGNIDLSSSSWNGFQVKGEPNIYWNFGESIASADINGDGLSDLIVGAPGASSSGGQDAGKTYVFFGNKNGLSDIDLANLGTQLLPQVLQVYGDDSDIQLGSVIESAKDLNKDGVNDLVILGIQEAYVFYGNGCESLTQCDSTSLSPICYASQGCVCGEYNLYFQENACVSECSEGYYVYTAICELCPTGCSSCTSVSTCQTCSEGYVLKGTSCEPACPTGYHLDGQTCQSDDVSGLSQAQTIGSITGTTEVVGSATLAAASLIAANDPGSVTASTLVKMLQYIQFLDLPYSQRLGLTFKKHNSTYGPYGLGPKMPEKLLLELPFHSIPYQFLEYHVTSNFLVNFWDSTIFLAIIIGVLLLVILIEWSVVLIKKKSMPIIEMVRTLIQNFYLMQFYNVFGDILLFLVLDFKNVMLVNSQAVLSFFLAILFLSMGCTILAWHAYILIRLFQLAKSSTWASKSEEFEKKYNGSTVLFVHFKANSFFSQSFLLFFVLRNCLFNLILALLSDYPLVQAILIFIMSVLILVYLLILRPFKGLINLVQQITCEVFLLIVNTCVLILAQIDFQKGNPYPFRDHLCEVIIYTSLIFGFIPQAFLGLKIVVAGMLYYKEYRKKSSKKYSSKMPQLSIKNRFQKDESSAFSSQNKSINDSSIALQMVHNLSNIILPDGEVSFTKTQSPRSSFIKDKLKITAPDSNSSQGIKFQNAESTYTSKHIRTYNQQTLNSQAVINTFGTSQIQEPKNGVIVRDVKEIAKKMGISQTNLPKWKIARKVYNP